MNHEENPKSIKYYVKRYIESNKTRFQGKTFIDFPAGNGVSSRRLKINGAIPHAFDLFPEYFNQEGINCKRANIKEGIPMADTKADYLLCQEGIEHFSDQLEALKEFNKVLKKGAGLIITTPNYSNINSRVSYMLSESERFKSIIAPNELDSIWMSDNTITSEIYYGHIFLIGASKLRCLARLAGFELTHIEYTRKKTSSLLLLPFLYPWIWLVNKRLYKTQMRKNTGQSKALKRKVYHEIFKLNTDWKLLVDSHIFFEFKKTAELNEIQQSLKSDHDTFGLT